MIKLRFKVVSCISFFTIVAIVVVQFRDNMAPTISMKLGNESYLLFLRLIHQTVNDHATHVCGVSASRSIPAALVAVVKYVYCMSS